MPLPTNKTELLQKLLDSYKKLDSELDGLSKADSRKQGIQGGISVCDVLAYQIGWGQLLLIWEKSERSGKTPEMPSRGFKWNELGRLNESFYQKHHKESLETLRTDFRKIIGDICSMIEKLSEKEIFKPKQRKWTGEKWAMVKWIQINTIAPYSSARTKVRRWKKELSVEL
jgi:hypothetical protein